MINLNIYTVRSRGYIDEIHLNAFEQTYDHDRFKRVFELAIDLAIIDLIYLNEEVNLVTRDPIVLTINIRDSKVLFNVAQTIINSNNSILNKILSNYLSISLKRLFRKSLQFIIFIDEFEYNLDSFLIINEIKLFRDKVRQLSNISMLLRDCYTLTCLDLTTI